MCVLIAKEAQIKRHALHFLLVFIVEISKVNHVLLKILVCEGHVCSHMMDGREDE